MKLKKLFICLFSVTILFGNTTAVYSDEEHFFTDEEIECIMENNETIDDYMSMKNLSKSSGGKILPMVPIRQKGESNCGPAVACMIAKTMGLGNYTEEEMATKIGTNSETGSSSYQIKDALNKLLSEKGRSGRYEVTTTSMSNLVSSIIYSIDNDFPVVVNVKIMPEYTSRTGHFIAVNGYSWGMSGSNAETKIRYCDSHPSYSGAKTISAEEMLAACNSNGGTFTRLGK